MRSPYESGSEEEGWELVSGSAADMLGGACVVLVEVSGGCMWQLCSSRD